MQLDDVREQLHELADHIPEGSTTPEEVLRCTRRVVKRRRMARGVGVLVVALVVLATAAIITTATTSTQQVTVSGHTATEPAGAVLSLTASQLRAHEGGDAPKGWGPVDEGDARLWVPETWLLETPGECVGSYGTLPSMVSIGRRAQVRCGTGPPAQSASLVALGDARVGRLARVVNGYRVYLDAAKESHGLHVYDVPGLGVQLGFRGALTDRVLATLGPSARKVALAFAEEPVPSTYRTVREDGDVISVPGNWPRTGPGAYCGLPSPPVLARVQQNDVISCPPPFASVGTFLRDGVFLYQSDGEFGPQAAGPIAVLDHGSSTVSVYASGDAPTDLEVVVRRSGSAAAHEIMVGLGRDGRVAGAILASIRATS